MDFTLVQCMENVTRKKHRLPVDVQSQGCLVQVTLLSQIENGWGAALCLHVVGLFLGLSWVLNWLYRLAHNCLAGHSFVQEMSALVMVCVGLVPVSTRDMVELNNQSSCRLCILLTVFSHEIPNFGERWVHDGNDQPCLKLTCLKLIAICAPGTLCAST